MTTAETERLTIAVVIPALNEEASLGRTLNSLSHQTVLADQILVADGGSTDSTTRMARDFGAEVVDCPIRGRGNQIAAAMATCRTELVLVVHADMILSPNSIEAVRSLFQKSPECPGGCLGHRFDSERRLLRFVEWWDRRRAIRGMSYGDQGQFFRRALLDRAGGFPNQPIMEDVELSRRFLRLGRPICLDIPALVSSRRFDQLGWLRTVTANIGFRVLYAVAGLRACHWIHRNYSSGKRAKVGSTIDPARS